MLKNITAIQKNQRFFEAQLRKPSGSEGKIVGKFLQKFNFDKSLWAIECLALKPDDCVLEIGFGTGYAIQHMSEIVTRGKVYGLDFSGVMVEMAKRKNARKIKAGKVAIEQGDINNPPYSPASFEKIMGVNVMYFWKKPVDTLRKIFSLLKPGGKLVLYIYHKRSQTERLPNGVFRNYAGEEAETLFRKAGFRDTGFAERYFDKTKRYGVCIWGIK